jgi:CHAT domain-containing protein/Tfp pilus assembly protein PilF
MRSPIDLITFVGMLIASVAIVAKQELPQREHRDANRLLADGLYEQAEAAARDRVNSLRNSLGEGSLEVANAADLLGKVLILNGRATSDESLSLAESSLRIKEAQLGRDHPDLASSLFNLGDVLAARAEFERAILVSERALAIRQKHARPDSLEVAEALDDLGFVLLSARRHDSALRTLEASLRLKEKWLEPTDANIARTLEDVGLVLQRMGEYEKSGPLVRRATAIRRGSRVDHPEYVRTLNLLAQQLWFEGQLIDSRETSELAVQVAERTLRTDHPLLALSLRYLAATLEDLGDLERSIEVRKRALAIAERNFGPNHHETATYLHALGSAELREGAYTAAQQRFREALTIYETRYGAWHEYVAAVLSMLARADASLGDYSSARRAQSRVVAIRERMDGANHPFVANALTDMANTYREEGRPQSALPLLNRALSIREKSLGPGHREVARTLTEMAATLQQVGRTTAAQAAATRALAIWERLGTPNAPEYATALALYAELQVRRGNDEAATEYYEKAMRIRANVFGTASPNYAEAQAGYALALANLGDRTSALNNAVNAESTGRSHLRTMLRSLPERQSLTYAAVRPKGLDLVLSLALSSTEPAEPAMDIVVRSRAIVLDEMATRRRTQQTAIDDPLRTAFITAQQRLANLVVRGPGESTAAQFAIALDNAQADSERAEQALAKRSAEFRAERSRAQLGLDDVRAALPSDSVLLSFVAYERTLFRDRVGKNATNTPARSALRKVPSYLAFVVRPQGAVTVVRLGSAHAIDSLVARWREGIRAEAAPAPAASTESKATSRESGVALRRLIWDPVAPLLTNANRVFIVADGSLSLVPFVALPVGQRSYLIDRAPVIHYQSSERDLIAASVDIAFAEQGLLAVGGPAFDDSTLFGATRATPPVPNGARPTQMVTRSAFAPCDASSGVQGTFSPLGGTLKEVRDLATVWNTSARSRSEESRVLVGQDASEPAVKKEAHRYRVLHLATHGFFLSDACLPGSANTRAVGGLIAATKQRPTAVAMANPLLLSGLALAGANRRGAALPGEDDGILTAEEVATLDLSGVEWAVLSACDTGLGEIRAGEGVLGLRRAFQIAGAKTVIMSLWSVDDQATREWMVTLYQGRFQKQLSTADAVHAATIARLRDRRAKGLNTAPFYWAAFVAAGDWR